MDNSDDQRGQKSISQSFEKLSERQSLHCLPTGILLNIVDFLNDQDHWSLAQTNRQQLFFWATINRVPASRSSEIVTTTPDVTELKWSDEIWPDRTHPTLIINIDTKKNLPMYALNRLNNLKNLEDIQHLHFVAPEQDNLSVDLYSLLHGNPPTGKRLISLESLVFKGISMEHVILGVTLPKLCNLVIEGRATPLNWHEKTSNSDNPLVPLEGITYMRPQLRNITFFCSQLRKSAVRDLFSNLSDIKESCDRVVEIRENNLDLEGNKVIFKEYVDFGGDQTIAFEESWHEGVKFSLRPWVLDDNGDARIGYQKDHVVAGVAKLRTLYLQLHNEKISLSWDQFLMFLSPKYFELEDVFPVLCTWSLQSRLDEVLALIPETQILHKENHLILVLPLEYQKDLARFLKR